MEGWYKPIYGRLAIGGILSFFLGMSWFLVLPYVVNTFEKNQVRNELTERIHLLSDWEDRYYLLTEQNQKLFEAIQKIESNALNPNLNHLITEKIYDAAQDLKINIKRLVPNNLVYTSDISTQEIEIDLEGKYNSIARFIQELEKSDYNIAIKTFNLRNQNNSTQIETSLVIMITYLM